MKYLLLLTLLFSFNVSAGPFELLSKSHYLNNKSDEELAKKKKIENISYLDTFYAGITLSDLNEDGLMDVITYGNLSSTKFFLNKGKLNFEDVTRDYLGEENLFNLGQLSFYDFDGDGKKEMLTFLATSETYKSNYKQNWEEFSGFLWEKTDGGYKKKKGFGRGIRNPGAFVFSDFNKDGITDVFIGSGSQMSKEKYKESRYSLQVIEPLVLEFSDDNNFKEYKIKKENGAELLLAAMSTHLEKIDGNDVIVNSSDFAYQSSFVTISKSNGEYLVKKHAFSDRVEQNWSAMSTLSGDFDLDGKTDFFKTGISFQMSSPGEYLRQGFYRAPDFKNRLKFSIMAYNNIYNCELVPEYEYLCRFFKLNYGLKSVPVKGLSEKLERLVMNNSYLYPSYLNNRQKFKQYLDGQLNKDKNGLFRDYAKNETYSYNNILVPSQQAGDLPKSIFLSGFSWTATAGDLDLDGYPELFIGNGGIEKTSFLHPSLTFQNTSSPGEVSFKEDFKNKDIMKLKFPRGAVFWDLDNDGDLDFIVNQVFDRAVIFKNTLDPMQKGKPNVIYRGAWNTVVDER